MTTSLTKGGRRILTKLVFIMQVGRGTLADDHPFQFGPSSWHISTSVKDNPFDSIALS
jgi:hypothetical protein